MNYKTKKPMALSFLPTRMDSVKLKQPSISPIAPPGVIDRAYKAVSDVMLEREKIIDNLSQYILDIFGIKGSIPTNLSEQMKAESMRIATMLNMYGDEPLLKTYVFLVRATDLVADKPADRQEILAHMLAIISNESGFYPQAAYWETDRSGNKVLGAYGLFQFRKTSWNGLSSAFLSSELGNRMKQSGLLKSIASFYNLPLNRFSQPLDERVVGGLTLYQLVPMMAQTDLLLKQLDKYFIYDSGRWKTRSTAFENKPIWTQIKTTFPELISSQEGGRQMILSIMHMIGAWFLIGADVIPQWALDRVRMDVKAYSALITNPGLREFISKMMYGLDAISYIPGRLDPTSVAADILNKADLLTGDPSPKIIPRRKGRSTDPADYMVTPSNAYKMRNAMAAGIRDLYKMAVDAKAFETPVDYRGRQVAWLMEFNSRAYPMLIEEYNDDRYNWLKAHPKDAGGVGSSFNPHRYVNVGGKPSYGHFGSDIRAVYTMLYAPADGQIVRMNSGNSGTGNYILLKHKGGYADGWYSEYMHLSNTPGFNDLYKKWKSGQVMDVKKGDKLALSGNTGYSASPHLHWGVWDPSGIRRDPTALDIPFNHIDTLRSNPEPFNGNYWTKGSYCSDNQCPPANYDVFKLPSVETIILDKDNVKQDDSSMMRKWMDILKSSHK